MSDSDQPTGIRGVAVIEAALTTMPFSPGVYRLLDAKGDAVTMHRLEGEGFENQHF